VSAINDLNPQAIETSHWLTGGGEMGERMRAMDWEHTPLGPLETWSVSLKMMVRLLLANRFPILLWWGPEFCQIYNDAYKPILGTKHPRFLGRSVRECWAEIWHILKPLIETPFNGGPATWMEDLQVEINRYGFLEETHFTIAYSPVPDETVASGIGGVLATVHEITDKVISERRIVVLRDLSSQATEGKTAEDACSLAARTLAKHSKDVPFALLYLIDTNEKVAKLAGTAGIKTGTTTSPLKIELSASDGIETWPITSVLNSESSQVVDDLLTRFGEAVPTGPWSDPPQQAVVTPIRSNIPHQFAGVLVAGVSSRLKLDDDYQSFIELVASQIATAIANARAYDEERKRAEALAELDRAKTLFFSNVSHEFRTPLTLILGPLEDALVDSNLPQHVQSHLELAQANSKRLLKLVNTLLDFSRIEAGRVDAVYEATDLSALTSDLASVFRSTIERAGIELDVDCPTLTEQVFVDREMWEKIVLNLISNAFKFTFEGKIKVSLRQRDDSVQLSVTDTGTGIAPENLPRLFERFYRPVNARGRSYEGSGIGLALVQELVRLHSGRVNVTSELHRGTTFTITIPLGKEHLPPDRVEAERLRPSTNTGAHTYVQEALSWLPGEVDEVVESLPVHSPSPGSRSARILLVDDNSDMLHYLRRLLNATYDVTAVGDGVAALAKAKEQEFDLVLTDIMMPRLDGVGLLNALRADQRTRSIPVIFLSARAGEESRIEGLSAGADDYLVKPFSAHELLARVESNLKLSQLRRSTDESVAKRNARLSLLWEAAGVLLTTNDPDAMLSSLFEKIRTMLDLDVYFNFMVNESGDALRLVSYGGVPAETATAISRLEFGTAVCGRVALRKEPIIATRIQDSEDPMVQLVKGFGVRAYACNPLLAGGKLLGTVSFASRRRDSFEQEEIEFLETISKYITAAYERLQLIEQLRDQDRRKDEFLATLAHELRNPLAPMHNGLQLIRLATSNPATLEQARTMMERQLKQMKRLVDDLLDVSRISRNKLDLRMELTELASIVGSAIETSQPLLEAADQRLRVSLPIEPVVLNADPVRLAQAFSNLLNNAAKYSGQGSEIWFEVEQEAGEAIVRVRDNGIGIPVDQLKSVFDIFVQVDRSLERSQGGLGVGLTLVKQLVQMHGGRVEVRSEGPGKGTEFIVRLPVVMRQQTKAPAPAQVTAPLDTNGGQRILVVDDNVDSAESLSLMLELLGHKVSLAHDGLEAVEAAKQFKPDIAFLDLGMPKMNGYDAARLIREQPENRGVKLVALTGWGQEEDKRRSHDAGFDMHLVKPIDFSALEKLLEQ
jgi:signal transduction histidine kinase/DNA-binding response OmpR family regulator